MAHRGKAIVNMHHNTSFTLYYLVDIKLKTIPLDSIYIYFPENVFLNVNWRKTLKTGKNLQPSKTYCCQVFSPDRPSYRPYLCRGVWKKTDNEQPDGHRLGPRGCPLGKLPQDAQGK